MLAGLRSGLITFSILSSGCSRRPHLVVIERVAIPVGTSFTAVKSKPSCGIYLSREMFHTLLY
jgi:hypothetical protein